MQHRADEISKKLISVLKKDSESINYFQNEIERIEKLNVSWKQNIIRVGIIGITSSGKSTLLNAILGEDLLPGKVAPTSGVIVGSMKGDVFKVNIKYNDGITENILNKKLTRKKLQTLADEKNNPSNKYNVNQIEIKSSKFIPPYNDLKILDSPGLNAFNLETHEKITFEQLLREIDICVFLTSLKANADKDDEVILQKINDSNTEYNKTIIVVQNKLDSVRSKPGRREGISKTKEQVIEEHGNRIKRLCEGFKMNTLFCQISAIEALNWRLFNNRIKKKSSRIEEFLEKITEAYEKEKSQRHSKRIKQTVRIILDIMKIISEKIKIAKVESPKVYKEEEEIDILKENYKIVNEEFKNLKSNIEHSYENWSSFIDKCLKDLNKNDPYDVKSAKNLITNINKNTKDISNNISNDIKQFEQLLRKLIKKFNRDDLNVSSEIFERQSSDDYNIETYKETTHTPKTIPKKVEKPGIINWIIRKVTFGKYGYTKQNEYGIDISIKNKINIKKEKDKIENLSAKIFTKNESAIKKAKFIFKNQLAEIKKELDNKINNLSDKKNKLISIEVLKSIESELNSILDSYDIRKFIEAESYEKFELTDNYIKQKENLVLYEIPKHIYSLYRITELKTKYLFDRIWNSVLTMHSDKSKPVIIWAWDYDPIIDFSNLFIYDNKINEEKLKSSGFETEMINNNQYIYIDRNRISEDTILKNKLHKYLSTGVNIFTILNISQPGSTEKNIKVDKILISLFKNKNNNCNWIYNDFQNEINSNSLEEATKLFIEFPYKVADDTNGCYLINHSNPVYSLMFLEFRKIENESDSMSIKRKILKNSNIKAYLVNTVENHINVISKTFLELNSTNNGK